MTALEQFCATCRGDGSLPIYGEKDGKKLRIGVRVCPACDGRCLVPAPQSSKDETLDSWLKGCDELIESGVATDHIVICPVALRKRLWELKEFRASGMQQLQDVIDIAKTVRGNAAETSENPARDADHCDFPDCEQHWTFVVEQLVDFMEKRCVGIEQSADAARWELIKRVRAAQKSGAETAEDSREWVFLHRPGMVPQRKGPFHNSDDTVGMLEALYQQHPDCTCDVVTIHGRDPWPDDGREYLDIRASLGSSEKSGAEHGS